MMNEDAGRGQEVKQTYDSESPEFKKVQKEAEQFCVLLMKIIHGKQSRDQVMEMLKASSEPFQAVPPAMNNINDMAYRMASQGGQNIDPDVMLASSGFLFNDLLELASAAGLYEVSEEEKVELYQDCLEMHIEKGLADGSIDPVQLQLDVEDMMTEQQKAGGMGLGEFAGTPAELSQSQITQHYADGEVKKKEAQMMDAQTKEKGRAVMNAQQGPVQQATGAPALNPQEAQQMMGGK